MTVPLASVREAMLVRRHVAWCSQPV